MRPATNAASAEKMAGTMHSVDRLRRDRTSDHGHHHTTSKEVIRYTKAADQKVLAKSAVKLMDQAVDNSGD
jgi:hypothetical protein